MLAHTNKPRTQEAEAGRSGVQNQPGLPEPVSKRKRRKRKKRGKGKGSRAILQDIVPTEKAWAEGTQAHLATSSYMN